MGASQYQPLAGDPLAPVALDEALTNLLRLATELRRRHRLADGDERAAVGFAAGAAAMIANASLIGRPV